jgi:hypothetical protein
MSRASEGNGTWRARRSPEALLNFGETRAVPSDVYSETYLNIPVRPLHFQRGADSRAPERVGDGRSYRRLLGPQLVASTAGPAPPGLA